MSLTFQLPLLSLLPTFCFILIPTHIKPRCETGLELGWLGTPSYPSSPLPYWASRSDGGHSPMTGLSLTGGKSSLTYTELTNRTAAINNTYIRRHPPSLSARGSSAGRPFLHRTAQQQQQQAAGNFTSPRGKTSHSIKARTSVELDHSTRQARVTASEINRQKTSEKHARKSPGFFLFLIKFHERND